MKNTSPEVDRYIENAAPFAQPILRRIREAFHEADPRIVETIKWSMPFFEYKGIVGTMSAFKQHVAWGFWKAKLVGTESVREKVTELSELPPKKEIIALVRQAVELNEKGVKIERPAREPRSANVDVPPDLAAALKKNAKARATFDAFPPSHKREYVEWITEAKQEATRQKRLAQAVEWMSEGKSRHWKYARK
ncbi:MAG TPA: YdeI/OmpD-associated family protein [Thermoanaerobaculia bacterium]|nr:YdeI/OmpD-associated family protein [Thermoanaerobaculia bacterium]